MFWDSLGKAMLKVYVFIIILIYILFVEYMAKAEILYENKLDDVPNWHSPSLQNVSGLSTTHEEAKAIGFTSYRATDTMGEPLFTIASDYARGNGKGLRVMIEARSGWAGGGLDIHFGDPDLCGGKLKLRKSEGYDELYIRFFQKFDNNWKWREKSGPVIMKIFRLYSNVDYNCKYISGSLSSSKDCNNQQMTAYMILDWQGAPNYIIAWREEPSTGTMSLQDYGCSWADYFADGQWHCVEAHVRMNDINMDNTIADLYIDGERRGELPSSIVVRHNADRHFNTIVLFDNHTLPTDNPFEQAYYIDDIVISTSYIGPDYVIGSSYTNEDVNQDGSVDINDVQLVVNVILGKAENSRADVNRDGSVTISDTQEVVNSIIG